MWLGLALLSALFQVLRNMSMKQLVQLGLNKSIV
jgi:hypothetical protein